MVLRATKNDCRLRSWYVVGRHAACFSLHSLAAHNAQRWRRGFVLTQDALLSFRMATQVPRPVGEPFHAPGDGAGQCP